MDQTPPRRIAFAAAALSFIPFRASAATLHVPADFATIQSCIDAATSGQDECVVAPGTYNELINFLGKAITLRSSAGPEVTTIDGTGLNGTVVTCNNFEGPDTTLEGFTITGGTGSKFAGYQGAGGMLNYFQVSPTVTRCIFRENTAELGGAMFNYVDSSPTIIDCDFLDNDAQFAGGVFNYVNSSPALIDCTFEGNSAPVAGGAMVNLQCDPFISGCTFKGNSANLGGAVYSYFHSSPIMTNCRFETNAASSGGAIFDNIDSPSTLDHCVFIGNTAQNDGGAIANDNYSREMIFGCEFRDNRAVGVGGAIANKGFGGSEVLSIFDSTFEKNEATMGGAIFTSVDDNVTITNCLFNGNQASGDGGAIFYEGFKLEISACHFLGNVATNGGGISSPGGHFSTITDCMFEGNIAANWGGGIFNAVQSYNYASTLLQDCIFLENEAREGGGYYNEAVSLLLTRSTFQQNSAEHGGGLVFLGEGGEISHCLFERNSATDRGGGLSMFNFGMSAALSDCTFLGNRASLGGGVHNESFGAPSITNCLFSNNLADAGGAIFEDGDGAVRSCSFRSNRAMSGGALFVTSDGASTAESLFVGNSAFSGAVLFAFENITMARCTLIANQAEYAGGVADGSGAAMTLSDCILRENSPDLIGADQFTATFRFSDIQDGVPSHCTDAGGNIDLDPSFVRNPSDGGDGWGDDPDTPDFDESTNDDFGDLRLTAGSPCINAGDPDFAPEPGETDLDGHARILCGRLDLGAYEFGIGDFDCDQSVTLSDLFAWRFCSTDPAIQTTIAGRCEAFDFDADGDIDLRDFARLMLIADS